MFKPTIHVIKTVFKGVSAHSLMTFAAAIAFYTIFSLPGLLITIVVVVGVFFGQEAATGELGDFLNEIVGAESARSIEGIILQIHRSDENTFKTVVGIATLVFSATTIFISLQEALNKIWDVVAEPKRGFLKYLMNRVMSLGMIVGLGFILIVSLISDVFFTVFFEKIQAILGREPSLLLNIATELFSFLLIFIVISLIFKFLPDVKLKWKNVYMAAFITSILFILGKIGIQFYLKNSSFTETYQAAGSIVVLLIWVYYSTVVVLFGAEITRAIMLYKGTPIRPSEYAKKVSIEHIDYETYKSKFGGKN